MHARGRCRSVSHTVGKHFVTFVKTDNFDFVGTREFYDSHDGIYGDTFYHQAYEHLNPMGRLPMRASGKRRTIVLDNFAFQRR
jgi:hypothetical protein